MMKIYPDSDQRSFFLFLFTCCKSSYYLQWRMTWITTVLIQTAVKLLLIYPRGSYTEWYIFSIMHNIKVHDCERTKIRRIQIQIIWAMSSEKVSSNMRKMYRFRWSRVCAKSHPGLCSPLIHSIASNDSVSGQQMPWSDCTSGQSDLGLCCLCMSKGTFLHGAAHNPLGSSSQ